MNPAVKITISGILHVFELGKDFEILFLTTRWKSINEICHSSYASSEILKTIELGEVFENSVDFVQNSSEFSVWWMLWWRRFRKSIGAMWIFWLLVSGRWYVFRGARSAGNAWIEKFVILNLKWNQKNDDKKNNEPWKNPKTSLFLNLITPCRNHNTLTNLGHSLGWKPHWNFRWQRTRPWILITAYWTLKCWNIFARTLKSQYNFCSFLCQYKQIEKSSKNWSKKTHASSYLLEII